MNRSQAQRIQQVASRTVRSLYRRTGGVVTPVESLESRRLMSVSYNAATDTVTLTGTNANDTYNVSLINATTLRVTENGVNHDFNTAASPVSRITGSLFAGNDTF